MRWWVACLGVYAGLCPAFASAQFCPPDHIGCNEQDADWLWDNALFDDVDFDSGWVPGGSPLQVRLTFRLAGETVIMMAGRPTTSWPPPIEVRVPGHEGTGYFAIDYGLEIRAFFRFDVNVGGIRFRFEEEIDIPFIPSDLRFFDELMFDPFLLPDAEPVMVEDQTERFPLVELDLAGFVGIPGIGGGLRLDTEGELRASYRGTGIFVNDATPIVAELGPTVIRPADGETDFGASQDLLIHPEGILNYTGALVFAPTVFLDVVGTGFDIPIADIPIDILSLSDDVVFDDVLIHVPLPDIDMPSTSFELGEVFVGETRERLVRVENRGEALLVVDAGAGSAFSAEPSHLEIPPMSSMSMAVTFAPEVAGPANGSVFLTTNDPDESMVLLRFSGTGLAIPMPDAGVPDAGTAPDAAIEEVPRSGGCGCQTGAGPLEGIPVWLALAFVVRRRRTL